ncbi:CpsD/CapB family tyrosine-protein kinase [Acidaminobacter hydrogenoformans]|uniref:non-specific protein-tyrosine kinase n=1 Tax=Acidaminobacter hydrogenoformans DSM 2784 TaxID=1120920 RepID=A0A1G5RRJ6_9FIRM|nr:CpsD/CapB family tyrosine-protein kinase [Acidaminobacter hydrogenoformans]SCZ76051.1 capsular exopolysaccharide family [Acidaminobacter hydrogenoformans DSM 2784]
MDKLIVRASPKSPVSEAYRTLRTNIQFSNLDHELKSILFTSAMAGEGKTTTIINLGIVVAKSGKRVLIVDSDLRKPTIHKHFEMVNIRGLSELLLEDGEPTDYIVKSSVEGLDLLLSGTIPPNPSEMLGSRRMMILTEKLRREYDLIFFDAPPVGIVTDAQILSTIVDGTILVLAAEKTDKREALYAVSLLENVNCKLIGTVLNRIPMKESGYYQYRHRAYYDQNDDETKGIRGLLLRMRRFYQK